MAGANEVFVLNIILLFVLLEWPLALLLPPRTFLLALFVYARLSRGLVFLFLKKKVYGRSFI